MQQTYNIFGIRVHTHLFKLARVLRLLTYATFILKSKSECSGAFAYLNLCVLTRVGSNG